MRELQNSGFVDFRDYFGRFSVFFQGVIYAMLILPPEKKRKIGSKEPENRQNLSFATPSNNRDLSVCQDVEIEMAGTACVMLITISSIASISSTSPITIASFASVATILTIFPRATILAMLNQGTS